jgi:hypothetical protein
MGTVPGRRLVDRRDPDHPPRCAAPGCRQTGRMRSRPRRRVTRSGRCSRLAGEPEKLAPGHPPDELAPRGVAGAMRNLIECAFVESRSSALFPISSKRGRFRLKTSCVPVHKLRLTEVETGVEPRAYFSNARPSDRPKRRTVALHLDRIDRRVRELSSRLDAL